MKSKNYTPSQSRLLKDVENAPELRDHLTRVLHQFNGEVGDGSVGILPRINPKP